MPEKTVVRFKVEITINERTYTTQFQITSRDHKQHMEDLRKAVKSAMERPTGRPIGVVIAHNS